MTYENDTTAAALSRQLNKVRDAQVKADCRALLKGGHAVTRPITQENNGHKGRSHYTEEVRGGSSLVTGWAIDDYTTWK